LESFASQKQVSFYPFSEGAVLHKDGDRRLVLLNSSAAFIWCLLAEMSSKQELVDRLVGQFGIERETATTDLERALQTFAEQGLLMHEAGGEEPPSQTDGLPPGDGSLLPAEMKWEHSFSFCTLLQDFTLSSTDGELLKTFSGLYVHLNSSGHGRETIQLAVTAADSPGLWDVYLDNRRRVAGLNKQQVLPWLVAIVFDAACAALDDFLLLHSAVLVRSETTILMPAVAGSGKTTLAAAMVNEGWTFFSDELALVEPGSRKVHPFPLPMAVKPGSLEVLSRIYPDLKKCDVHLRNDKQLVRYLLPPSQGIAGLTETAREITSLVFPRYRSQGKTSLRRLAPFAALQSLAVTGSSRRPLAGADIECLMYLAGKLPCYGLEFDDIDEAVRLIDGLVNANREK